MLRVIHNIFSCLNTKEKVHLLYLWQCGSDGISVHLSVACCSEIYVIHTHTHTDTQRWSENIADHWLVIKNRHLYDTEQPESSHCLCSDRFLKHVCFIFSSLLSCWSLAFSETKFVSLLWNTATYWKLRTPSLWYPLKVLCLCSVEDNVMAVSWGYCYDYQLRILPTSRGYHLQWKTKIEKITWYQKWVELSRNMQWKQDVWCVLKSLTHQNV